MGLLDNLKAANDRKQKVYDVKTRILQRMTMEQLATLYDAYVDTGASNKDKFIVPGSVADLIATSFSGTTSRPAIVKKIAQTLTLDMIKIKAAEFKVEIKDIQMPA